MSAITMDKAIQPDIDFILNHALHLHRNREMYVEFYGHNDAGKPWSIKPDILASIDWKRDFTLDLTDDIRVIARFKPSTYMRYLRTNLNKIHANIITKHNNGETSKRSYRALVVTNTAEDLKTLFDTTPVHILDTSHIVEIEFQLINKLYFRLIGETNSNVYQNTTVSDVIEDVLYNAKGNVESFLDPEVKFHFGGIQMISSNNPNKYGNIVVPFDVPALEVPGFLQQHKKHGVYNCGMGTFVTQRNSKHYVYVYPLTDTTLFDKRKSKLLIVRSRNTVYGMGEKTACLDGNILKIIPEFNYRCIDHGAKLLKNPEEVMIHMDIDSTIRGVNNVNENGKLSRKDDNLKASMNVKGTDGYYKPKMVGPTNNMYRERSNAMARMTAFYQFKWNNSDIELLYPGMPCRLMFAETDGAIVKLDGMVASASQVYNPANKQVTGMVNVNVESYELYKHKLKTGKNKLASDNEKMKEIEATRQEFNEI